MKHSVLYLTLAACLLAGCHEEYPGENTGAIRQISFLTNGIAGTDSADTGWKSTRAASCPPVRKSVLSSEDGRIMSMDVSCEPMPEPFSKSATRGSQVYTADITAFGVSGAICMNNSSYTAVGCGSLFYNEAVAPGVAMSYSWPTDAYRVSFFAHYPYGNENLTMASLPTDRGIPTYSYTVPEDVGDQVDVMTAQVTNLLGGQQEPVALSFRHHCAALRFILTNTGEQTMTVRSLTVDGVKYTGTLNNGTWRLGNDVGSFTLPCDTEIEGCESADLTGDNYMFMLPQTLPSTAKVILETDKNTFEGTVSGSWAAGQVYTFRINANDAVNYLRFTAIEDGTFTLTIPAGITTASLKSVSYSLDEGETWVTTDYDNTATTITTPTVTAGNSVLWKGDAIKYANGNSTTNSSVFSSTGRFNASGSIMSLLYGVGIYNTVLRDSYTFTNLFANNTNIVDASGLLLSATTLVSSCYRNMFDGCTSLTAAPELPATTLTVMCYSYMFRGCTSLTAAPELPATSLSTSCYNYMFDGCTSLTAAPELPATTLANSCYQFMFRGCTSLTAAPELPATSLATSCYNYMFDGCTSLTAAPELPATKMAGSCYYCMFQGCTSLTTAPERLPATTLANYCYSYMFDGCSALTAAPELPATTLADNCYNYMFNGCRSLTTAPELPATTLANYCYSYMFQDCRSLTAAPELPATTLADQCYYFMFSGCSALSSAPELPATALTSMCYNNMFRGCTSLTAAPELPATTLTTQCYANMFNGCTSLTTAPELPATTLTSMCYNNMFYGCRSLTAAPELPATTLADNCYGNMFNGCRSLTAAPELPATTLAGSCYASMFRDCTSLTTAPELPATSLSTSCYAYMFYGCTSLTAAPELPAMSLVSSCYNQMFYGCRRLNYIKAAFTTKPSASYCSKWVSSVSSTGTFVKNAAATWNVTGTNGIPSGWTVETYTPE